MKIGDIIRSLRIENSITQKELADKLSISPSTIGMYEQNRRIPDVEALIKLASYFGVQVDYLLGITSDRIPDTDLEWRYPHVENRLGTLLSKYRFKNNLTEKDFAEKLNISEELEKQIEIGIYIPSINLLQKIANITGYDIDYIIGAKDCMRIPTDPMQIDRQSIDTYFIESDSFFRARFEEQCLRKGITNENVSNHLGLSPQTFLDIQYNRMPTLSELLRISYGFGVSMDYLIGKTDTPFSNLSSDELELILNYRDCLEIYKKNIRERAEKLSIESANSPSVAADEELMQKTGTDSLGK